MLHAVFHKKIFFFWKPYNKSFIDQACSVKMAGYWLNTGPVFRVYGPRLCLSPLTCKKKHLVNIQLSWPHAWSITHVIIWLAPRAGKMIQIVHCDWLPERARWSYLARSGLPAAPRKKNFPESHIINPLLTKFVRSRWLDIGLILFLRVYKPWLRLGP